MGGYDMLAPEETDTALASLSPDAQRVLIASTVTELHEVHGMQIHAVDVIDAATNPVAPAQPSAPRYDGLSPCRSHSSSTSTVHAMANTIAKRRNQNLKRTMLIDFLSCEA